jgi:hypothetical protein
MGVRFVVDAFQKIFRLMFKIRSVEETGCKKWIFLLSLCELRTFWCVTAFIGLMQT